GVDGLTLPDALAVTVHDALDRCSGRAPVAAGLRPVEEVGLGYLRLGEPTPSLSGGESQRLRAHPGCAVASTARCTFSTSHPPACTRSTWPPSAACSTGCRGPGPPSSAS